jgi:cytokinesis protein
LLSSSIYIICSYDFTMNYLLIVYWQKSKEKNTQLEDQHRRNEISMRRKQAQTVNTLATSALSSDSDAPKSPASTGAMDDLLQKLRAAKPEARDQRDRRRRARLKDRHQVRVASGQKIPELGINVEGEAEGGEEDGDGEKKMLSPTSEGSESATGAPPSSAEVDIADRAAAMLEGLQGGSINKDGSLSVRRRRESADTERQRRRNRRQQAGSARTEDGELMSPIIQEEGDEGEEPEKEGRVNVIPPSPEGKGRELPTPPPE